MVIPTVGRCLHYFPPGYKAPVQPFACTIALVLDGGKRVNLSVVNSNGAVYPRANVLLVQEGDERPPQGDYCAWPTLLTPVAEAARQGFQPDLSKERS